MLADPEGSIIRHRGVVGVGREEKTNFFLILLFYSRNQKWIKKIRLYIPASAGVAAIPTGYRQNWVAKLQCASSVSRSNI
jgi:hypothetical protein